MTKPMYCPMAFNNPGAGGWGQLTPRQCTPGCAWAATFDGEYACSIAILCKEWGWRIKTRPLKDDE